MSIGGRSVPVSLWEASEMRLKTIAKTAGTAVLVLIAIDLIATAATVAAGAVLFKR